MHSGKLEDFVGRTVVVTGGLGALGGAVVAEVRRRGGRCVVPYRSGSPPSAIRDKDPDIQWVGPLDLTSEAEVRALYEGVPDLWASIHCAGGFAASGVAEETAQSVEDQWRLNFLTAFLCCREAVRCFRRTRTGGRIVNVAARPALEPRQGAGMVSYTASKAAVAALTCALAEEVAAEGIWVNAVVPSILDTEANRRAMPDAPAHTWPSVEDAAETIVFLASPLNRCTRGGLVPVYGRA
ncbi:MAG: SDR family NAD(P)-dependent oxidoreductase [Acidobacteriota bacterium]